MWEIVAVHSCTGKSGWQEKGDRAGSAPSSGSVLPRTASSVSSLKHSFQVICTHRNSSPDSLAEVRALIPPNNIHITLPALVAHSPMLCKFIHSELQNLSNVYTHILGRLWRTRNTPSGCVNC